MGSAFKRHCQGGKGWGVSRLFGTRSGPRSSLPARGCSWGRCRARQRGVCCEGSRLSPKAKGSGGTDVQRNMTVSAPINHTGICLPLGFWFTFFFVCFLKTNPCGKEGFGGGSCQMRKEKRVATREKFLFPWVRGIRASSKRRAGCVGTGFPPLLPPPASPNNGRAMPAWTRGRGESKGSAFMALFL